MIVVSSVDILECQQRVTSPNPMVYSSYPMDTVRPNIRGAGPDISTGSGE